MEPILLKDDIYWVGAVDFNLRNFHRYSRSPQGSTYNAYLVKDEKNVLFDTVDEHYCDELIKRISEIMDPTEIDYIVCNHMEKDHAGSIERIVEICKPEKIFCSVMGEKSLKAQFNTEGWPIQVVKDGERLNIGKRNITFLETRMLHWPDSMVSYLEEDKVLFSNDAFGQNVATSCRYVDEYDRHLLLQAMKDYYYNIILPYSPLVLKAVEKINKLGLEFDMIAPDHGLIYRTKDDIKFLFETYAEMATQPYKLRAVIAFESLWGATKKMAYAVGDGLASVGVPYTIIDAQENHCSMVMNELADSSALILGSSTRNNMPLVNLLGVINNVKGLKPKNLVGAAFGSYGWSGESPKVINDELAAMGVEIVAEPVKAYFGPNEAELTACFELGKKVGLALKEKVNA